MPYTHLSEDIIRDAEAHIRQGWTNGLIAKVLSRVYNLRITAQCIKNIRTRHPCSKKCPQWCK